VNIIGMKYCFANYSSMDFMKKYLFPAMVLVLLATGTQAQLLTPNQPEQNVCNALQLCGTQFTSPYSYQGTGTTIDIDGTPCGSGEENSVWLKLVVSTSGSMVFTITPVSAQDDYDFAVIDATGINCNNIGNNNVVRCNFNNNEPGSNLNGAVGLSMSSPYYYVQGGTFGNSKCRYIDAVAGQTYYIMINNFGNYNTGGPSSGFTIDFTGSTATFNSTGYPTMDSVKKPICNYKSEIIIQLSEEVKCSSIATNGSDFYLTPSGNITSATGINCSGSNGYTDRIKLTFSPPLQPGNYAVHAQQGNDGNTLLDLCNNPLQTPAQLSFKVPKLKDTVYMTKCAAQLPFVWNGLVVNSGGANAASVTTTTAAGCDSVTVLNLTVTPSINSTVTLTKCADQMPFTWNGFTISAGGNGVATYSTTTAAGCDSNVTLNVIVLQPVNVTVNQTICVNQLPYVWNGITVAAAGMGVAVFNTTSVAGCDSNVTLNLIVTPIQTTTVNLTKCTNELPFVWNGTTIPAGSVTTNNIAQFSTTTATGCDSLVTLNLTVNPVQATLVYDTVCASELPLLWNGITVNAGGAAAAVYNGSTTLGCDSIVTLNLYVKPVPTTTVSLTICQLQLPYYWNGITVNAGGNAAAVFTTTGINGCDSVVTLNLTVIPTIYTTVSLTRCADALPFVWNGINISQGGANAAVYTTVSVVSGCDSVVTLNLTVQSPVSLVVDTSGCGEVTFEGITYTQSVVLSDTFTTAIGCDSVYRTVNVIVNPVTPVTQSADSSGCGYVNFHGITYTQDTAVTDTIVNQFGCDSVYLTTNIIVYINEPAWLTVPANGCHETVFEGVTYLSDTAWVDTFKDIHGCDSLIRIVNVYVEDFQLELSPSADTIAKGEYLVLSTSANVNYSTNSWEPAYLFENQHLYEQTFIPDHTHEYQVIAVSDIGCLDTATVSVYVDTLIPDFLMPNAFSPNGDGINDFFGPVLYNKSGYVVNQFRIYNRWGNVVYTAAGKRKVGWDGTYGNAGKEAAPGVYNYLIEIRFVDGKTVSKKGDVTLIR